MQLIEASIYFCYLEMKDKTFIADYNFMSFNDLPFLEENFFLVNWHQQKYKVTGNIL